MSLKTKNFVCCGGVYRTKQFAAVPGLELLYQFDKASPLEVLEFTEVQIDDDWFPLNTRENINDLVVDPLGYAAPLFVLKEVCNAVKFMNFGFLDKWVGIKIPSRFQTQAKNVRSEYTAPIVSNLIQADKATLRELEEYYSVEDAFKMFDIVLVSTVNKAYAHEEAEKESKRRK